MANQLITGFLHVIFLTHLKAGECVNFSELFLYGVFGMPCQTVHQRTLAMVLKKVQIR